MPAVLKTKIDAGLKQSSAPGGMPESVKALFEPLQNSLCEMLQSLTKEEFEPAAVTTTTLGPQDMASVIDAAGLKIHFKPAEGPEYFGLLALSITAQITQHSLLFSESKAAASKDYSPSRLDCLLLQPMAELIADKMSQLFQARSKTRAQIGLSFQDLGIGKADFKALGDLAQIKISLTNTSQAAVKSESNKGAKKAKENKKSSNSGPAELFFNLTLPQSMINNLASAGKPLAANDAPVIDPTHPWAVHMRQSVNSAHVPVRAVVESCAMTVAECTRLEIGQVIALPGVSLNSVRLFIDMETGPLAKQAPVELTRGALGIFKKNRALKMSETVDPDFIQDLNLHSI